MSAKTIILHISDLHIRNDKCECFERTVLFDTFIKQVKSECESRHRPEIIIVTGDIAYSGIRTEYEFAGEFLETLIKNLGYENDRLFIVPGNHDVNRRKYRPSDVPVYKDMNHLNRELGNYRFRDDLLKGMTEYFKFVEELCPHLKPVQRNLIPFVSNYATSCGKNIGLLGLNSAWMCRKSPDQGEIAIGEYQMNAAEAEMRKMNPFDLLLCIMHHPIQYLWYQDREIFRSYLSGGNAIVLCGHLHEPTGISMDDLSGRLVQLQSGSLYSTKKLLQPSKYYYLTIDWEYSRIEMDFRAFDPMKRKWYIDCMTGIDGHIGFDMFNAKSSYLKSGYP
ncbi:metallophosphoesterase [bacterium]|nr:metallophosphoesterase [candidate division CSSED10-310 bacterium]